MRKSDAYITSDGSVFLSFKEAHRHADNRYGNALTKLAHDLCACDGKYKAITDFLMLDSTTERLREMLALRDDISLVGDDNDDQD